MDNHFYYALLTAKRRPTFLYTFGSCITFKSSTINTQKVNEKERPAKSTITQKKIGEREIRNIGDSNGQCTLLKAGLCQKKREKNATWR